MLLTKQKPYTNIINLDYSKVKRRSPLSWLGNKTKTAAIDMTPNRTDAAKALAAALPYRDWEIKIDHVLGEIMTTYYTKDQAERIIADWGIAQPLPRKGMQVGVQWVMLESYLLDGC